LEELIVKGNQKIRTNIERQEAFENAQYGILIENERK
jgi:hypothetical protein